MLTAAAVFIGSGETPCPLTMRQLRLIRSVLTSPYMELGGVLLQQHFQQLRPVAYAPGAMTEIEQCYSQIERETLRIQITSLDRQKQTTSH